MGEFFIYILKSSVCLSLLYMFYRLLLSKDTFYAFNRVAIILILIISTALPAVRFKVEQPSEIHQAFFDLEQILMQFDLETIDAADQAATSLNWIHLVLLFYFAGIVAVVIWKSISIFRLVYLIHKNEKIEIEKGVFLIILDKKIAPFSWGKYAVISRNDYQENGKEILTHEVAHIKKYHSVDLFIADLFTALQWFNPASWLMKQEMQIIHEYEADKAVLDEGIDAKKYQLLLIKKAVGSRLYSIANNFNHSNLKKRITMMSKRKSNPWARLKYAYVLPLIAISITAFARPEISVHLEEISSVKVNDFAAIVESRVEENQTKQQKELNETTVDFSNMKETIDQMTQWTAELYDEINAEENIMLDYLSVEIMNDDPQQEAKSVKIILKNEGDSTKNSVSIVQRERMINVFEKGESPIIIVDGKDLDKDSLNTIDPNTIKSVSVLKDKHATDKYGEKGKYGVVEINLKKEGDALDDEKIKIIQEKINSSKIIIRGIDSLDGELVELDSLSKGRIESIKRVAKDRFDGDSAVVRIRKYATEGKPVYIVNGKQVTDISSLSPEQIESLSVLKDKIAIEKYGENAKNGVIVVSTKKTNSPEELTLTYLENDNRETMPVSGIVKDENAKPIIGAVVMLEGTKLGTVTDMNGNFTIIVPEKSNLLISYIGKKTEKVKAKKSMNIKLKSE